MSARHQAALHPEWAYLPDRHRRHGKRYPLTRLFAYGAAHFPDRDAISDGTATYTFAELELGTQRVAHVLARHGVRRGSSVVILARKRALLPLLAAAIWKLGAVYVPIDAENPESRNRAIFDQVAPAVVLGDGKQLHDSSIACGKLTFDELAAHAADPSSPRWTAQPEIGEEQPAYVIFTSGSTGLPKGVMISHRSLLDYFYNHNRVLRFSAGSRVFSLSPFHFDVSIEDTLLPLSLGAYVYQFQGMPLGPIVLRLLARERITHLIAVSTLLTLITKDRSGIGPEKLPHLEMVMTGAEVCDPKIIDIWKRQMPGTRVINAYGPTEATIVCLTHTIDPREPAPRGTYPIGRPLDGVSVRLVGEQGEIVEPEHAGELWVGGSQVMIGYLGMPDETRRVIATHDGIRYYRTGDICRVDRLGRLEFVGRVDDEVKLAGRRIHLGEIRHFALKHPKVARAATGLVRTAGRQHIALIVISDHGDILDQVLASMAPQLPEYMLPRVAALATSPQLSSTGKTDEKQLMRLLDTAYQRHGADRYVLDAEGSFSPVPARVLCR